MIIVSDSDVTSLPSLTYTVNAYESSIAYFKSFVARTAPDTTTKTVNNNYTIKFNIN